MAVLVRSFARQAHPSDFTPLNRWRFAPVCVQPAAELVGAEANKLRVLLCR